MNIFKRIAALFKRKTETLVVPDVFDIHVRVVKNAGYSFDEHLIGNVYPARRAGNHYDVWAPAIAASIPEGGHHNMEHVYTGGGMNAVEAYWSFTPNHVEVVK